MSDNDETEQASDESDDHEMKERLLRLEEFPDFDSSDDDALFGDDAA